MNDGQAVQEGVYSVIPRVMHGQPFVCLVIAVQDKIVGNFLFGANEARQMAKAVCRAADAVEKGDGS